MLPSLPVDLSVRHEPSLSFRLWIPQVRGQPHGFSFSIQLDSWHPPRWAAGPPCCAWRRRSISFSVFLCSVIHLRLPPRSAWHNHPLLAVVYAHTSQPGLPYLIRDTHYSKDATDVIISFPVSQGKTKDPSIVTFSFQFSPSVPLPAFSMSMPLNHRSVLALPLFYILFL